MPVKNTNFGRTAEKYSRQQFGFHTKCTMDPCLNSWPDFAILLLVREANDV